VPKYGLMGNSPRAQEEWGCYFATPKKWAHFLVWNVPSS